MKCSSLPVLTRNSNLKVGVRGRKSTKFRVAAPEQSFNNETSGRIGFEREV